MERFLGNVACFLVLPTLGSMLVAWRSAQVHELYCENRPGQGSVPRIGWDQGISEWTFGFCWPSDKGTGLYCKFCWAQAVYESKHKVSPSILWRGRRGPGTSNSRGKLNVGVRLAVWHYGWIYSTRKYWVPSLVVVCTFLVAHEFYFGKAGCCIGVTARQRICSVTVQCQVRAAACELLVC